MPTLPICNAGAISWQGARAYHPHQACLRRARASAGSAVSAACWAARIAGFYDAATPRDELPRCLASLPPAELAAHRYARIDYRHARRMLIEVAPLPVDLPANLGDRVELWPQDCDQGRLSRISKIMPPAPPPT